MLGQMAEASSTQASYRQLTTLSPSAQIRQRPSDPYNHTASAGAFWAVWHCVLVHKQYMFKPCVLILALCCMCMRVSIKNVKNTVNMSAYTPPCSPRLVQYRYKISFSLNHSLNSVNLLHYLINKTDPKKL